METVFLVGTVCFMTPAFAACIYTGAKMKNYQKFTVGQVAAMSFVTFMNVLMSWLYLFGKIGAVASAFGNCAWFVVWYCAIWAFVFKYWQTAYELKWLFRFEDARDKNSKLYLSLNALGYTLNVLPMTTYWLAFYLELGALTTWAVFGILVGCFYSLLFFSVALQKMSRIVKHTPGLKTNERFFALSFVFIGLQAIV